MNANEYNDPKKSLVLFGLENKLDFLIKLYNSRKLPRVLMISGKKVNRSFIDHIHKFILQGIKSNITFILKVSSKSSKLRLKKRKTKNRYDNFAQSFYTKAQKSFLKIAKNKKNYFVLDSSLNNTDLEKKIFKIVSKYLKIK